METRTFKYDPNGFSEVRKMIIARTLPVLILALGAGIFIGVSNGHREHSSSPVILAGAIVVCLIAGWFGLMRGVKRQKELYDSYRLTIDDSGILREQLNTPAIRIRKSDITLISKNGNGSYTIKGRDNREMIGVGTSIEGRDELEALLRQIRPFDTIGGEALLQRYATLSSVIAIGLMVVTFISDEPVTVALSGGVFLALMAWSFVEVRRSKHIDTRTKRNMYLGFFPAFAVLAKIAFLWL